MYSAERDLSILLKLIILITKIVANFLTECSSNINFEIQPYFFFFCFFFLNPTIKTSGGITCKPKAQQTTPVYTDHTKSILVMIIISHHHHAPPQRTRKLVQTDCVHGSWARTSRRQWEWAP